MNKIQELLLLAFEVLVFRNVFRREPVANSWSESPIHDGQGGNKGNIKKRFLSRKVFIYLTIKNYLVISQL